MKSRLLVALTATLAVVAALLATVATGSSADAGASRPRHQPVYWIDLGGTASQHPDYVFFTANSGGYMKDVTWRHWGAHKTVGRGTFGTTAPCNPDQDCTPAPARITMTKPVRCTPEFGSKKGRTIRVYRHATIVYPDFQGGTARADISDRAGWATCKQAHRGR